MRSSKYCIKKSLTFYMVLAVCCVWLVVLAILLLYVRTNTHVCELIVSKPLSPMSGRQPLKAMGRRKNHATHRAYDTGSSNLGACSAQQRIILQWTRYFGTSMFFKDTYDSHEMLRDCPVQNCRFTVNTGDYDIADAVVFHGVDLLDLRIFPWHRNLQRRPEQLYIFEQRESPARFPISRPDLPPHFFNLTMTYRLDSDFPLTYYTPTADAVPSLEHGGVNYYTQKRPDKLIAMFISTSCHLTTLSDRLPYALALQRILGTHRVHIFGACTGNNACPRTTTSACDESLRQYYFYLAFENSICNDYVTEKLYRALQYGAVPVVNNYRVDYNRHAPKGSYIHTKDFASPAALAVYLEAVAGNESLYNTFMAWRGDPQAWSDAPLLRTLADRHTRRNDAVCRLCAALNDPAWRRTRRSVKDIYAWWAHGQCANNDLTGPAVHMVLAAWPAYDAWALLKFGAQILVIVVILVLFLVLLIRTRCRTVLSK